jgi:hypothetical protein
MGDFLLRAGDEIFVKISKENEIVSSYADYNRITHFQIVAVDIDEGYFVYIPEDECIKEGFILSKERADKLGIKKSFIGSQIGYVRVSQIDGVKSRLDGLSCSICSEYFPMSRANQNDGLSLICFVCRHYRSWNTVPDED